MYPSPAALTLGLDALGDFMPIVIVNGLVVVIGVETFLLLTAAAAAVCLREWGTAIFGSGGFAGTTQ